MLLKRSKENTKCVSAAGEELTATKHNKEDESKEEGTIESDVAEDNGRDTIVEVEKEEGEVKEESKESEEKIKEELKQEEEEEDPKYCYTFPTIKELVIMNGF
nr:hypothetical protein [Tanacetum cinerariifolium]